MNMNLTLDSLTLNMLLHVKTRLPPAAPFDLLLFHQDVYSTQKHSETKMSHQDLTFLSLKWSLVEVQPHSFIHIISLSLSLTSLVHSFSLTNQKLARPLRANHDAAVKLLSSLLLSALITSIHTFSRLSSSLHHQCLIAKDSSHLCVNKWIWSLLTELQLELLG